MGTGKGTFDEPRPCVSGNLLSPIWIKYPLKSAMLFQNILTFSIILFKAPLARFSVHFLHRLLPHRTLIDDVTEVTPCWLVLCQLCCFQRAWMKCYVYLESNGAILRKLWTHFEVLLATQLSWIDITIGYNYLIKTSHKYNRNTFDTANHTVLIVFLLIVI